VTHYVNSIKVRSPQTLIAVVYFNSNIEYAVNGFAECEIIPGVEGLSV
jgi:hypothetical protein